MRFYKALLYLYLYPTSFRAEYGEEMRHVFAQRRRLANNPVTVTLLCISTFFKIAFNAAHVHWDILRQDLAYTVRGLARAPGFAITTILVTALGVGANTAIFSITDHVLICPLPYPDSDRIVKLCKWGNQGTDTVFLALQKCGVRPLISPPPFRLYFIGE